MELKAELRDVGDESVCVCACVCACVCVCVCVCVCEGTLQP